MSNIDVDVLIALIEARPVIWDKTLSDYKDKNLTKNAWEEVCTELYPRFSELEKKQKNEFKKEVTKRWWHIRDNFVRSLKKVKYVTKSRVKKYIHNDQLQFLLKVNKEYEIDESLGNNTAEDTTQEVIDKKTQDQENKSDSVKKRHLGSRKRKKLDPVEIKMMKCLEEAPDRHLSFFKGIMPSLQNFDEDDVLKFQMGVLQLISNINYEKRMKPTLPVQQSDNFQIATNCIHPLTEYNTYSPDPLSTHMQYPSNQYNPCFQSSSAEPSTSRYITTPASSPSLSESTYDNFDVDISSNDSLYTL